MRDFSSIKELVGIMFFLFAIGSLNGLLLTDWDPLLLASLAAVNTGVSLCLID